MNILSRGQSGRLGDDWPCRATHAYMGEPEVLPVNRKCLEIDKIAAMGRTELLRQWPDSFDVPVPRRASPEFLRMALAWRAQAERQGASTSRFDRRLRRIGESIAEGRTPRALDDRPKAGGGAVLVRSWCEKSLTVTVSDKGYVLEGVTYRSLWEVARKITGTRWNEPHLFGLRSAKGVKTAEGIRGGKMPLRRCAVYTRKSSEEGLRQEFNSLDAQREAGIASVRSQAGEGWRLIESEHDIELESSPSSCPIFGGCGLCSGARPDQRCSR